ncbi:DUF971 domain-containing protein [Bradyrhizobium prioriisuperbiae]|uniref:DUF971 domain-containing protein n=1 Tax=Bradyrhizobium prioriisuperbiae TaxID=2854389 RepID=UPI0028E657B9|nr:DUF971 domain-containing protein [Bradyrhizobium prioritasuperba]
MSQVLAPTFPSNGVALSEPNDISCNDDNTELRLAWPSQPTLVVHAGVLRAACKCAHCIRARIDSRFPESFDGISITAITLMGNFGINIGFSDGHARGIYPWPYLQEIAARGVTAASG